MPYIEMPPGFSNCALKKDKSFIRCRETINLASSIFLKKCLFVERGAPFLSEIEETDRSIYIQFHPPGKELCAGVTYEKGTALIGLPL